MRLHHFFAYLALALTATLGLSAQTVRVIFVSGQAQIQPAGETALRPLLKGDVVTLGSRIVTGPDGRVALTPLPGVNALITPDTDLLLESASESPQPDGTTAVAATLDLKQGAIVTDILRQEGVTYDYNVRTPRGLAGARGTNYTVGVNAAGIETVVVSEGSITFNLLDGRQIAVTSGQITITDITGEVRQAASLGELSEADQAFAQEIAEATLEALESALESGIEINPVALDQALQLFENFGLDVSGSTLQLLGRLRSALEALRDAGDDDTDAATIITERREDDDQAPVTGTPFEIFVAGLNSSQALAFAEIIDRGGFDGSSDLFLQRFSDTGFTTALLETVNLYVSLSTAARDQAVTLGILGDANEAAIGANSAGLARLLESYATTSPAFVAQLEEAPFGASTNNAVLLTNNFFNGGTGDSGLTVFNVSFGDVETDANLQVGATRSLNIQNNDSFQPGENTNFEVFEGRDIIVRASESIGLTGGTLNPITFSSAARGVLIEGITINLSRVTFTEGSVVVLTSRDGGVTSASDPAIKIPNFGSSVVGRVNFINDVFYGEFLLDSDESFVGASRGNIRIASFADGLNPEFPDYTPLYVEPTPEELFIANLTEDQLAIYNNLPPDVRLKLVDLDDADITGLLLSPDRENGVPFTSTDTNRVLDAYTALSTDARDFIKTLGGGSGLPNLDGTPDILRWSSAALEAAAATFNNLEPAIQNALISMEAGDAIIGLKADYVTGLVIATSFEAAAIAEAGWGRFIDELVTDDALSEIDEATSSANSVQRDLIRRLRIDPYQLAEVLNSYEGDPTPLYNGLTQILSNMTSAEIDLLAQIGFNDTFALFASDSIDNLNAIISNYNALTPEQQTAARALRLGSQLSDSLLAAEVTDFYLGLSLAQREAMRDTDLVNALSQRFGGIINEGGGEGGEIGVIGGGGVTQTQAEITTAIDAYLSLTPTVQNYLISEGGDFDLLAVLNSDPNYYDYHSNTPLRPLSEIVSILETIATDATEYDALLDLDLARAIFFTGHLDPNAATPSDAIREAIGFFLALTPAEQSTLRELGIAGTSRVGFLGSDYTGVVRLLKAYAGLPTATRVNTLRLDEYSAGYKNHGGKPSYFFPYNHDYILTSLSFASPADLHVGAVRRLRIDNSSFSEPNTTFIVQGDHTANIHLRAGDLIELTKTPIAGNARGILMEAITINLTDIHFPEGTTAALTSRDGTLNFGSSNVGGVNFISGNTYGGSSINSQIEFDINSRGNIAIGSFSAPAVLPNYTAPIEIAQ